MNKIYSEQFLRDLDQNKSHSDFTIIDVVEFPAT